jgi:hypothetical protein
MSAILGATVAYLLLRAQRPHRADALLKTARREMTTGNHEKARVPARVVQQRARERSAAPPRRSRFRRWKKERDDLACVVAQLRANEQQSRIVADLQKSA